MKPQSDESPVALEALRDRSIVTASRDYARRWEQSRAQVLSVRAVVFASAGVIAAACMAAYAVLAVWPAILYPAVEKRVETHSGETQAVALDDGTRIVLDASSQLRVAYNSAARDVALLVGQAHFKVAKDPRRPFRVHTKFAEVVAVGTAFDVVALPERTTVTLLAGRVNVRPVSGTTLARRRVEALEPGEQLGITGSGELLKRRLPQR